MFEQIKPLLYIAALVGAFSAGSYVTDLRNDNTTLTTINAQLTELNARKDQINDLQQSLAASQAEVVASYQKGKAEAEATANGTIDAYRAGNIRLRKQLQCTSQLLRSMPDATTTGQLTLPDGNCGLSTADVEFLIHFAAETNRLRDKVNSLISAYNGAKLKIDQFNKGNK